MDTKTLLQRKSAVSYVYLLLALASFSLTFLLPNSPFYFIQDRDIFFTAYPRHGDALSFRALLIWLAGIIYGLHFYYGSFHYPKLYSEALQDRWSDYIDDFSSLRGYFPTALVILYFSIIVLIRTEPVPALLKDNFWAWVALWVTINIFLSRASQTCSPFKFFKVEADLSIIDPEGGHEEGSTVSIGFYLPDEELSEDIFALAAIKAYAQDLVDEREYDLRKAEKIRDISNQAVAK